MHKRKYVMSNTAEAVVKAVRSAEALEKMPLNAEECLRVMSDFISIQADFPYSLNGIPEMILNYVSSENADMEALKPVIEGFVQLCRTDYLDYFNDSPNGGCKNVLVEDYLGSESDRHALMVYIVSPFMENIQIKGHTNYQEARAMADALHELGYSVDIINPWYEGILDYDKYNLVIGFRRAFEDSLGLFSDKCVKIYYLTTTNSYVANMAELGRIRDFQERNGIRLPYERLEYSCMDLDRLCKCDGAICLGNDHTLSTYAGMFKRILPQNASGFQVKVKENNKRNPAHFMWYGGAGSIHKGVDLCIEAFRNLPELTLHIVGKLDRAVWEYYEKEINESANIVYHGFMYRDDQAFVDLCGECAFSIGVSCSEGQSTAMLTTIFSGMVPICNNETGIDTEDYGGIRLESADIGYLKRAFALAGQMAISEILTRAEKGIRRANELHTVAAYKEQLKRNINSFIS